MALRISLFIAFSLFFLNPSKAQISYSVLQVGGNLGFANEGYKGAFSGFTGHFIFGKSFQERAYLGLGIGNEIFKGDYRTNDPHAADQQTMKYDYSVFPVFIDGRLPFGEVGQGDSKIGILANAGYAPAIGQRYDKGFLFKGGFFYLWDNPRGVDFTASLAYGYQQLTKNFYQKDFQHQHISLSVGIMLK